MKKFLPSFKVSLVLVYGFLLVFALVLFSTSRSMKLNNLLHKVVPFIPEMKEQKLKEDIVSLGPSDTANTSNRVIHINTVAEETRIYDADIPQYISAKETYMNSSDRLILDYEKTADTLNIELSPEMRTIDLPLGPWENAIYDFKLGNLDVPTKLRYYTESSATKMVFNKKPLQELEVVNNTGDIELTFTKNALPTEGIKIETDKGDMRIYLPVVDLYVDYVQKHEGEIIINGEKYDEESSITQSIHIPAAGPILNIFISTTDAEIEITTGENLPEDTKPSDDTDSKDQAK